MHFDGVTEQLCKVTRQRLKKFLECRSKWAKLKCEQAEMAKKSYDNIDDRSVNSYMEKNPESINLEWYHLQCYKKFCDEEKIRRQQKKEEKGEGTSSKTITSTKVPHVDVEPIEPRRKLNVNQSQKVEARPCLNETSMYSQRYVLFVEKTPLGFHYTRYGHLYKFLSILCNTHNILGFGFEIS